MYGTLVGHSSVVAWCCRLRQLLLIGNMMMMMMMMMMQAAAPVGRRVDRDGIDAGNMMIVQAAAGTLRRHMHVVVWYVILKHHAVLPRQPM
jgi:hypothetical protein